jgi:hypothetical protein
MHRSPLKNMQFHYSCSYLSEQYRGLDLSACRLNGTQTIDFPHPKITAVFA